MLIINFIASSRVLYDIIREYFLANVNMFTMKDVLNLTWAWAFNKMNLIKNDDIFLKIINDYISKHHQNIEKDEESIAFLFNF